MAGRNGDESGRWRKLGIRLKQRRVLLDPRWRNRRAFAEDNHLDYRLIYDIEEARRPNFGVTTLAAIEVAYRLRPDGITAFLEGGELDAASAAVGHRTQAFLDALIADAGPTLELYLEEVTRYREEFGPGITDQERLLFASDKLPEFAKRQLAALCRFTLDGSPRSSTESTGSRHN